MVSAVVASVTISGAPVAAKSAPTAGPRPPGPRPPPPGGPGAGCRGRPSPRGGTRGWRPRVMSPRPVTRSTMRDRAHRHRRLVDHDGRPGQVRGRSPRPPPPRRTGRPTRRRPGGWGRTGTRTSAPSTASARRADEPQLPRATPSAIRSSSPGSTMGERPPRSEPSERSGRCSAHTTLWPEVGQDGRRGQAHVARPDDGHPPASPAAGRCTPALIGSDRRQGGHQPLQAVAATRAGGADRPGAGRRCRAPSWPGGGPAGAGRGRPW